MCVCAHIHYLLSSHSQHAAALLHPDWLVLGPGTNRSGTQAAEQVESQVKQGRARVKPGSRRLTPSPPSASVTQEARGAKTSTNRKQSEAGEKKKGWVSLPGCRLIAPASLWLVIPLLIGYSISKREGCHPVVLSLL